MRGTLNTARLHQMHAIFFASLIYPIILLTVESVIVTTCEGDCAINRYARGFPFTQSVRLVMLPLNHGD